MPLRRVFFYKKEGAESLRIFIDKENAGGRFLFLGKCPCAAYFLLGKRNGKILSPFNLYKQCAGKRSRRARRPFHPLKKLREAEKRGALSVAGRSIPSIS